MVTNHLRVLFLGGLGEVGKNMLVLEHGSDIIVIDAGIGFPDEDLFGIDYLLPDMRYLQERADRVRGIFITHGHEDHTGALSHLLEIVSAPVYCTRLTQGLLRARLKERRFSRRADLRLLVPEEDPVVEAGCFRVECFRVSHSIPDAVGFAIDTPAGLVVHSGDFKLDPTPVDGRPTDLAKLGEIGRRGPMLLISDCVHIESPGFTPSERAVEPTFDAVLARREGRVIVATFASAISRIQQVLVAARRQGRKVACVGRSLQTNVRVALELGYLEPPPDTLVRPAEAAALPPADVVYVCTGSQGEPMAVLSRIAHREHQEIEIEPGDTVVISATPIPGNETSVFRVIDQLFEQGADVIYSARALVHVSGHASEDELRTMLNVVRPRYVLPFHGEPRHLRLYARLAQSVGVPAEHVLLGENGTIFAFDGVNGWVEGLIDSTPVYVGLGRSGQVASSIVRERRSLARDGVLSVVVTIDRETGALLAGPEILARGFVSGPKNGHLLEEAKSHIRASLYARADGDGSGEGRVVDGQAVRSVLESFVYQHTRLRPLVLPNVLEV